MRPASAAEWERGTIEGAHFTLARPSPPVPWSGNLLLIAHGYRPESAPLVADLNLQHAAYRTLVEEGWMVAKTSYRRNGVIVADAIIDLDALRDHVVQRYGSPHRTIIEGDSLGGLIATLIAERGHGYDGAIAVGAALSISEPGGAPGVSFHPRIPLIFVANRSEIEGPIAYLQTSRDREQPAELDPVLLRIDRDGHVNVNQAERLFALRQINRWLDQGRAALPTASRTANPVLASTYFDATQPPTPQPSQVIVDDDRRGFRAHVSDVSAIYGNVWLDAQTADFEAISLEPGLWFELRVGDQRYRAHYGNDFGSVAVGEWVVFPNADGYFWLARNYGNAAEAAGLGVGDVVHLRRFPAGD